ncbi:MAG: hypothetical protein FWE57_07155 [Chitinispirillia bacterium]|nr:hypothetical protein [Chitinispirillia bacterium]
MTTPNQNPHQRRPLGKEVSFADFIRKHRGVIAAEAAEAQKAAQPKKSLNTPMPKKGIQISDKAAELIALAIKDMLRDSR